MKFEPKEYQKDIIHHIMTNPRGAIWASMGSGKTSASLTAIVNLDLIDDVYPLLVLAPLRVARSTWPVEVRKWDHTKHLRVSPIVGTTQERIRACNVKADMYTTNYDNLPWLVEHYGDRWPFKTVISDESTRLKSFRTRQGGVRTKALSSVAFKKINRFIELTGTPAPNGLLDLWGQLWFIDGGKRLGRVFTPFRDRWFALKHSGHGYRPHDHSQEEIQERIRDVCLTVDVKDYFDLKDPIVRTVNFKLPPSVRILYQEMEKELFMMIENHEVEAFNAAAKSQKLLQLCSGAVYVDPLTVDDNDKKRSREWKRVHDTKLDILESIVEEAAGMPVLVAYHFKSDLARLRARFKNGGELDSNPQTEVEWNRGDIPILFAHPASAGHGLNLQLGGNILVYFSHNWNLENRMQILERIGPMRQLQAGLDRAVYVYNIVAEDSIEELVIARTDDKEEVQDVLLAAMKRRNKK
jgi:SNF2 family DNA or RNA helicase